MDYCGRGDLLPPQPCTVCPDARNKNEPRQLLHLNGTKEKIKKVDFFDINCPVILCRIQFSHPSRTTLIS